MKKIGFKSLNNILGWSVFLFSFIVYYVTLEPSVSLWDCGEYISTSVKFQVGHPPGAPLFQMMGSLMGNLTADVTKKAFLLNVLSAVYSAFGIMFLFWVIVYFSKKILSIKQKITGDKYLIIFGSALVGSVGFTFTDTYWFNAVEAEVYAMMNCFTTMIFWIATKWDRDFGKPGNDKWLLLVALLVGLSPSIRFTLMLTIPSIVMMYYFNISKNVTRNGFIKANLLGIGITLVLFQIMFPILFRYFAAMELFFVNNIGLPFNSGTIIGTVLLISALIYGMYSSHKKGKQILYNSLLGLLFIFIGFSCYMTLMIRANAGTPINENNPSSFPALSSYYHREQYGQMYHFWGPMFTASLDENNPYKDGRPIYEKNKQTGKYEMIDDGKGNVPNFDKNHVGFFPRMFSRDKNHINNYKRLTGVTDKKRPSLADNINFYLKFQINYMYFRYLFWNFVGKQNDRQGRYDSLNGNWLSGINFIDNINAGPQEDLPPLVKDNNGRNTYYFLPFILAIIGMFYNYKKDNKSFYTILLFFLLTGIGIITYTNAKPFEPRERHYVFAVSFWVFSIWMGLGVLGSYEFLKKTFKSVNPRALALGIIFIWSLAVPVILAKENWADHNRSNRFVARDAAKAYLDSCEKNAILFVYGDNDTFPLWYVQEIEGYRRDIRVINTSLFETDWYIDQMKTKYYDEMYPVPSQITHKQYRQGTRDALYYNKNLSISNNKLSIKQFVDFISSDHPVTKLKSRSGKDIFTFPTKKISIPVDKQKILDKGFVSEKNSDKIIDNIDLEIKSDVLTKKGYMTLDIIANNNWERPIYFATSGGRGENYMWLDDYLQLEGLAYKLVPIKKQGQFSDFVDTEKAYSNIKKWNYGNLSSITMTYDADRRIASSFRSSLGQLARALAEEGDYKKSEEIADLSLREIPLEKYELDFYVFAVIESYYISKNNEKGKKLVKDCIQQIESNLKYYSNFSKDSTLENEKRYQISYMKYLIDLVSVYDKDYHKEIKEISENLKNYIL